MDIMNENKKRHRNSSAMVEIICQVGNGVESKCQKKMRMPYSLAYKRRSRFNGKNYCINCTKKNMRVITAKDDELPKDDDNMKPVSTIFNYVDTEEKAYALAALSNGKIEENHNRDPNDDTKGDWLILPHEEFDILKDIAYIVGDINPNQHGLRLPIVLNDSIQQLEIHSHILANEVRRFRMGLSNIKEDQKIQLAMIRGLFDFSAGIEAPICSDVTPLCYFTLLSYYDHEMVKKILSFIRGPDVGIPCEYECGNIIFYKSNAIDFLSKMYDNATIFVKKNKRLYLEWACLVPALLDLKDRTRLPNCLVAKTIPEAKFPIKERASDVGYDLWIVTIIKKVGSNMIFCDTGIKVQPEHGWYAQIVARSSTGLTGYIITNGVGIMDSYTGTIKITLAKIDPSMPDIQLPAKVAQIVLQPKVHFEMEEVNESEITPTSRGDKGHGSTNAPVKKDQ